MIAIAFGPSSMAAALDGLPRIREQADCVEFRLDLFEERFDLPALLQERGDLPAVVTLRSLEEGGRSRLASGERLEVLMSAAELGAEYVDLEWNAVTPTAIAALHSAGARVLVSRHDFSRMPDLAEDWWPDLAARGADIVKVVGTADQARDCLEVVRTLRHADRPTVAIAMGEAGLLSRVLAVREEQCFLTYAMLETGSATAPGQLSARQMRELFRADTLSRSTRVYGLMGPHAEIERLTEYNGWFASDAVDAVAVPVLTHDDAPRVVDAFRALPMNGWHVHGEDLQTTVGQALEELASSACRAGKVNAIVADDAQRLVGHWVESPREQYAVWLGAI
jgi:3-dehydroquinate dehydratase / shikimate dehydrogenase